MRSRLTLLVLSTLTSLAAVADTVQLKPVADTAIFLPDPASNFGKQNALPLGTIKNGAQPGRLLLRFDLSSVPTNAVVTNVTLRITVVKQASTSPKAETVEAHRLLKAWGEGVKNGQLGATATVGEATWLDRLKGQAAWGVAGGQGGTDFVLAASTSTTLNGLASYTFNSTATAAADVQSWLQDPASNFGWMLLSANESVLASAKRVASREDTTVSRQPLLTVGYSVPPPPPPVPQFNRIALQPAGVELGFHAEAGFIYTVSFRAAVETGVWQPLTNVIAKLAPLDALVTDVLSSPDRFYQVSITGTVD